MGKIMGIDPGFSGGIALIDGQSVSTWEMPVLEVSRNGKSKRELNIPLLVEIIRAAAPDHAVVELVGAMPGQGVSSMFAFGKGYGVLFGVLATLGIPYHTVSPVKWKQRSGVPKSKDGARLIASQLFPKNASDWKLKKHDGRAEAALIARYGALEIAA